MLLIIYFYLALVISEILSMLNHFTPTMLRLFNSIMSLLFVAYVIYSHKPLRGGIRVLIQKQNVHNLLIISIFPIVSFIAGTSIAPNNWDSMTYHFSRYLHWFNNKNLDYFTTSNNRENIFPTLPDILFAQIFSIFSNDRFLFILSWICIVVSAYYVFKITFLLSHNPNASYLASFITLIIPSHVAFLSSTQTDPVSTVLVVILLYYSILLKKKQCSITLLYTFLMVPLFIVTKTTGLILSVPIYIYILYNNWNLIRQKYVRYIPLFMIVVIPVTPYIYRLISSRHTFKSGNVFVENFSFSGIFASALRVLLSAIQTPIPSINGKIQEVYYSLSNYLNFAANPKGYGSYGDFYLTTSLHGDLTGNPLNVILIIISAIGLIRVRKYRLITTFIVLQFILLASLVGWQPWFNRFTSTTLTVGSIIVGVWISKLKKVITLFIIGSLVLYSSFWLLYNPSRSLLNPQGLVYLGKSIGMQQSDLGKIRHDLSQSREKQYFSVRPEIEKSYINAMLEINKKAPTIVYIKIGGDDFEYPIWALSDYKFVVKHFEIDKLEETKDGNSLLFCTEYCAGFGLKNLYKDEIVSVWQFKS